MTTLLRTYSVAGLRRHALLRGAASAFDLRGNNKRTFRLGGSAEQVDAEAVRSDWLAVGADLRSAMDRYSASS